ncbi:MAG: hypothetical protein ABSG13_14950 [Bryobacteraceae bacterium]|jgi:hypothetical protein
MALFSDGPLSDAADLQRYENAILNVASTESIDLGAKLLLAQQDVANELLLFLFRRASLRDFSLAFRRVQGVRDVVVTEPLRQWHVHRTLSLIYRDAYNNQLNDRYQGKWAEYEQLAKASARTYFQLGVGLVADPVPKGCIPVLSSVAGTAGGGMFYVAVTWVNTGGQEGAPSNFAQLGTSAGQQLVVSISGPPPNVTSWNVYVGTSPAALNLQSQNAVGTSSSWTMTSGPNPGAPLPTGQPPTWFIVDHRVMERG